MPSSRQGDTHAKGTHHATLAERVTFMEKQYTDSADRQMQALEVAHTKLDQLHGRLSACEKQGASLSELQKGQMGLESRKTGLEAQHVSMKERMDYLESLVGDSAQAHAKHLQELKSHHSKLAAEAKHRDTHHASMAERVSYLEKLLNDSADKHAEALAQAHAKLDHMHGRLSSAEVQATSKSGRAGSAYGEESLEPERGLRGYGRPGLSDIGSALEKIEQLQRAMEERAAREAQLKSAVESLNGKLMDERAAREDFCKSPYYYYY